MVYRSRRFWLSYVNVPSVMPHALGTVVCAVERTFGGITDTSSTKSAREAYDTVNWTDPHVEMAIVHDSWFAAVKEHDSVRPIVTPVAAVTLVELVTYVLQVWLPVGLVGLDEPLEHARLKNAQITPTTPIRRMYPPWKNPKVA